MTTLTVKQQHWSEIVDAWSTSGLSQVEYCKQHSIRLKSFYSWKHTIDAKKKEPGKQGKFLDIALDDDCTGNAPIAVMTQGVEIRYCRNTDKSLFMALIKLLRRAE